MATDFTDTDNYFNYTSNDDNAANDAHFGSKSTYDYFFTNFGRNSIDNAGFALYSYVHYSTGYVNAFWDGSEMTYGDGDGVSYTPLTSLDVVAHEITHGLTEHTAALVYSGESGALNESFSDIFGVAIDYYENPTTANYLMGDQINVSGTPFRSFIQPKLYGCPDTYNGINWNAGDIVHYNSSVQNHWFYLLAEGGSGVNDVGSTYTVNAIGKIAAAAISYRTLALYLTPNSTFADARTYSVQSATDLYGPCSAEVIQTTNAWYAVGVGGVFNNAVVAGFNVPSNYFCSIPAGVSFTNNSYNATTYIWSFGDGGTSTVANPTHQYNASGLYTVRLIANGSASCSSTDTLTVVACISVVNGGAPIPAACGPATTSNCCGVGIYRVRFNTIDNSSGDGSEGYRDYTCSNSTTLTAGDPANIIVNTGITNYENVKAFIDYNNDGQFNNTTEMVFSSLNKLTTHTGIVQTLTTATVNQPLRMRVMSDNSSSQIVNSCNLLSQGQAEDYTINFVTNTLPPLADFTADRIVVAVGDTIHLFDLTTHAPTSWSWSMPGANITSSVLRNPAITYGVIGNYTVTLTATNGFGSNTEIKTAYISVVNVFNMCNSTTTLALNGSLYDSGGPLGPYQDGESCTFLIQPPCADTIALTINTFVSESCCDFMRVYDGTSNTGILILNLFGSASSQTVYATSGSMYIEFFTDGSVTYAGFDGSWTTQQFSTVAPVALFTLSDPTPPLSYPVSFTDISQNGPTSWFWNFGDGNTSTQRNPVHAYATPGTFTITLTAFTCDSSDITTQNITVQGPPRYVATIDTLSINLACGGSGSLVFPFSNAGAGELMTVVNTSFGGTLEVLALTYGTDLTTEFPNTISSINQYFTNYNLTTVNTISPSVLQNELIGKHVFLIPEMETATTSVFTQFAPILQTFVNGGGKVVFCGAYSGQDPCIFNTGLFSGSFATSLSGVQINTGILTDSLLSGVSVPFYAPNGTFAFNITNSDKQAVLTYFGDDIVTRRNIGSGSAIYVAFDYYQYNPEAARIIANAIKSNNTATLAPWISIAVDTILVNPANSGQYDLTINTNGLNAGSYWYDLVITTNDPTNPIDTVTIHLNISGQPLLSLDQNCINYPLTQQNLSVVDSVLIRNSGCDALVCSSIYCTQSQFTSNVSSLTIPPFDSAYVYVTFLSSGINSYAGQLIILNNSNDTSVCLTGTTTGAPIITVNPTSFNVTLASGDSTTRVLNIGNIGSGELYFNINGSVSAGTLQSVLTSLDSNYLDITSLIPNRYDFLEGVAGYNISDGGNDMYDGGNQITVNNVFTNLGYSDNLIVNEPLLGVNGQYFTRKFNGLFVFAADINNIDSLVISGNLGADGGGNADASILQSTINGITYNGYVKRVYNTSDPSVNHIFITKALPSNNHHFSLNTNDDMHSVYGINQNDRVYYLLYASTAGGYIDNAATLDIMNAFLQSVNDYPSWLLPINGIDTVVVGSSINVDVKFNATGMNGGVYYSNLQINSNDPVTPQVIVPCTLTVTAVPSAVINFSAVPCSGLVTFNSTTLNNPTSYLWTFGDGGTSTLEDPIHSYATGGTYLVQFVTCNAFGCDTQQINLNIVNINGPVPANCSPITTGYCCGMGISSFAFNHINRSSSDGIDGYQDYSCSDTTTVYTGLSYPISVATGLNYLENVQAWIDYNNNGLFETTESIFISYNLNAHTGIVNIPSTGVTLNTPLRLRVGSDYSSNIIPSPCVNVNYGQFEDYTVFAELPTGSNDPNFNTDFSIYPNPFSNEAIVEYNLTKVQTVSINVFNAIGEKVISLVSLHHAQPGNYKQKLALPASGIYFVQLMTDDSQSVKRIVKME